MRTPTSHAARALAVASLLATAAVVAAGAEATATTCGPTTLALPAGFTVGGLIGMTNDGRYVGGVGEGPDATAAWWDANGVHPVATGLAESLLLDVNESGRAVGIGTDPATGRQRGFRYQLGATTVQLLPDLGGDIQPRRINESGVIAGGAMSQSHWTAVSWSPPYTQIVRLARAAADSSASGISDSGTFVGDAGREKITASWRDYGGAPPGTHDGAPVPVRWTGTAKPRLLERHGPAGVAFAVNTAGVVVGSADFDEYQETRAAAWVDGAIRDLGTLPGGFWGDTFGLSDGSWATGEVVTYDPDADQVTSHAFVWLGPDSGDLRPLPSLAGAWDAAQTLAHAVSDVRDEVGGTAWDADGNPLPTVWHCAAEITS